MATAQKEALRPLTAAERAALEQVRRATSGRVDRLRRATALLALAEGASFARAARQAGYRSGSAVTALVRRFNRRGLAALTIAAGRGRKPTYAPAARAHIVATAQRARTGRSASGGVSIGNVATPCVSSACSQGCSTVFGALSTPLARTAPVAGRNSVRSLAVPPRRYSCGCRWGSPTGCQLAPGCGIAW